MYIKKRGEKILCLLLACLLTGAGAFTALASGDGLEDARDRVESAEEQARDLAFRLTALQLDAIGPEEYETLRLRRLFQNRQPMMELEQELLHESVRHITVSNGTVTVLLKNNQTLEGGNGT